LELSKRDFGLTFAIFVIGYVFNSRIWILFLNGLTAFQGFLVYYAILYGGLFTLSRLKLIVFAPKVGSIQGTIGMVLMWFGFQATIGWTNAYIQYVTTGSFGGASIVYYQCEDGILWDLVSRTLGLGNIELDRMVALAVLPALIALVGLSLIHGKVRVGRLP
jgi:hypothetical protein